MGGALRAVETGFIQAEIQNAAFEFQRAVETGERIVVGVNRFRTQEPDSIPTFRLDAKLAQAQIERLRELRATRSQSAVEDRLHRLREAARAHDNLMPPILDAAQHYATVGEISDAMRSIFGEYTEGT